MDTKPLLFGIIGFIMGGLLVSLVAVTQKDSNNPKTVSTQEHNKTATDELKNLKGDDFDRAFMDEMINHHQGAIDMAKLIQTNAKHEELKSLGRAIISAQTSEIGTMQKWQGDWGYQETSGSHEDGGH